MSNIETSFEKGAYKGKTAREIKADLASQGYKPLLIKEHPNDSLASHQHPESHILVQIAGEMIVFSSHSTIHMLPGDKLLIPPNVEHAAEFGPRGSQYLWIEY